MAVEQVQHRQAIVNARVYRDRPIRGVTLTEFLKIALVFSSTRNRCFYIQTSMD